MPHFDATNAECHVFSYKEGVLAAVGHDLKLRVERFGVDVDPQTRAVDVQVDTRSLRVVAAVVDGRERPGVLSTKDTAEIERHVARDVLDAERWPTARFRSSSVDRAGDERFRVRGALELHGQTRQVEFVTQPDGQHRVRAEIVLRQTDFGIKPFSAMLGALRVRADVRVVVSIPWTVAPADGEPPREP